MAPGSEIRSKTCWVVCLSVSAAFLILAEMTAETVLYYKRHPYGNAGMSVIIVGFIAILVPCCGWHGVRERDAILLRCFSFWSICLGCWDVVVIGVFALCSGLAAYMTHITTACQVGVAADSCDKATRDELVSYCRSFAETINASIVNVTMTDIEYQNVTEAVEELLGEQHCIDTLNVFSYALLVSSVIFGVARLFGCGLHCMSGHCGNELRKLIDEEEPHKLLASEASDSSESESA